MRLLLFEYLHANPELYQDASPSMRAEGRAMLEAVAADIAGLGVTAVVAVCAEAKADLDMQLPVFEVSATTPEDFIRETAESGRFDSVFPIAPETDETLLKLVRSFRQGGFDVVALPTNDVDVFSDKWLTFRWLAVHDLPTPPTLPAGDFDMLQPGAGNRLVFKPKDGAGCEGVQAVRREDLLAAGHEVFLGTHIVQPELQGIALSVGLIGAVNSEKTVILPPAMQRIQWNGNVPVYTGSEIPAVLSEQARSRLHRLCEEISGSIGPIAGYVGVDFLLPQESDEPVVMEINPRLCSTYAGYRLATETNLMAVMLGMTAEIRWNSNPVVFSCD